MSTPEHFRALERLYLGAATNRYFEPRITVSAQEAEVVIPLRPDMWHPLEGVHGVVYFKALDDACFFAAQSLVTEYFVLTQQFNLYMTAPISEGELRAVGRVVHATPRMMICEGVAYGSDGREVARGGGTFVVSRMALPES